MLSPLNIRINRIERDKLFPTRCLLKSWLYAGLSLLVNSLFSHLSRWCCVHDLMSWQFWDLIDLNPQLLCHWPFWILIIFLIPAFVLLRLTWSFSYGSNLSTWRTCKIPLKAMLLHKFGCNARNLQIFELLKLLLYWLLRSQLTICILMIIILIIINAIRRCNQIPLLIIKLSINYLLFLPNPLFRSQRIDRLVRLHRINRLNRMQSLNRLDWFDRAEPFLLRSLRRNMQRQVMWHLCILLRCCCDSIDTCIHRCRFLGNLLKPVRDTFQNISFFNRWFWRIILPLYHKRMESAHGCLIAALLAVYCFVDDFLQMFESMNIILIILVCANLYLQIRQIHLIL